MSIPTFKEHFENSEDTNYKKLIGSLTAEISDKIRNCLGQATLQDNAKKYNILDVKSLLSETLIELEACIKISAESRQLKEKAYTVYQRLHTDRAMELATLEEAKLDVSSQIAMLTTKSQSINSDVNGALADALSNIEKVSMHVFQTHIFHGERLTAAYEKIGVSNIQAADTLAVKNAIEKYESQSMSLEHYRAKSQEASIIAQQRQNSIEHTSLNAVVRSLQRTLTHLNSQITLLNERIEADKSVYFKGGKFSFEREWLLKRKQFQSLYLQAIGKLAHAAEGMRYTYSDIGFSSLEELANNGSIEELYIAVDECIESIQQSESISYQMAISVSLGENENFERLLSGDEIVFNISSGKIPPVSVVRLNSFGLRVENTVSNKPVQFKISAPLQRGIGVNSRHRYDPKPMHYTAEGQMKDGIIPTFVSGVFKNINPDGEWKLKIMDADGADITNEGDVLLTLNVTVY